jgi:hypothetical protein
MNISIPRCSSTHFPRSSALRTLALLAALSAAACTGRKSSAEPANSSAERSNGSDDSDDATGTGHLHVTGDLTVDHDFVVDACQIAPPGDGLLAGYHMNAKDGDSTIDNLTVVVKKYDKDGPYSPAYDNAGAQAGEVMATGSMDFMTLIMAQKDSPMPVGIMLKPESKLVATISGNGSKGEIEFTDMESPLSFEDINVNSKEKPHGKRVSGSVTWTCGHVERLNANMNKMVNGMMKKLVPAQ